MADDDGLPLPTGEDAPGVRRWAAWVRRNYFYVHAAYVLAVACTCAVVIRLAESSNTAARGDDDMTNLSDDQVPPAATWAALFAGVSAASSTGLQIASTQLWTKASQIAWYTAAFLGSSVVTSVFVPLLTMWQLVEDSAYVDVDDAAWGALQTKYVIACAVALGVLSYVGLLLAVGSLAFAVVAGCDAGASVASAIAALTNSGPLGSLPRGAEQNAAYLVTVSLLIVAGNTLFPVLLRGHLSVLRWFLSALPRYLGVSLLPIPLLSRASLHAVRSSEALDDDSPRTVETAATGPTTAAAHAQVDEIDEGVIDIPRAIDAILASENPRAHHGWLFKAGENWELVAAWGALVALQVAPFLWQQWGPTGALSEEESRPAMKVLVAFAQCIANRFGGFDFLDLTLISSGHVCILLVALYVPTATGRTRDDDAVNMERPREFKSVFHRAGGSRHFWLCTATCAILFLEESAGTHRQRAGSGGRSTEPRGLFLPVLFEVLSAFFTCGLSMPQPWSAASLSSSFTATSQFIICLCMFFGRHRHVSWSIATEHLHDGGGDSANPLTIPRAARRAAVADSDATIATAVEMRSSPAAPPLHQ